MTESHADVEGRVEHITRGADLGEVAGALARRRDEILGRWLEATSAQPFHVGRPKTGVSDHVPHLLDALVVVLHRVAPRWATAGAPLVDEAVLTAAQAHARVRFEQGLAPANIVTEFRLLRQEIGRALRDDLDDDMSVGDAIGAELLIHDALDGAITLALEALTSRVEEVRDEFLATTIHDIRQPITGIKGNVQLARRRLAGPDPDVRNVDDLLRRAELQTDRLLQIVATLADASRLALGRLEPHPVPTGLTTLVRAAVDQITPEAAARIHLDIPSNTDAIGLWDGDLIARVVENLLSNALKYSPPERPIEVSIREDDASVDLVVRDRGIGLTASELDMLFLRYGRTPAAAERGIEGAGLGLYLSRGIVEAHGGTIRAESDGPGHGSTFLVHLPRRTPGEDADPAGHDRRSAT